MTEAPRILVVDDEPKIGTLLKRLLEKEGYDVDTCLDGRTAIRELVEKKPSLLITDIQMPGMNGLELARRARSFDPELPVVLITGYASMDTAVQALRDGVSDYITKPFSIAELKSVVGRILENRALAAENRRLLTELRVANSELEQHRQRLTVQVREAESDLLTANRKLEKRLGEMEVIHEISQMIATVFDRDDLLSLATQLVRDKVGVNAAAVFTLSRDGTELVARGVRGLEGGLEGGSRLPADEGLAGRVVEEGTPVILSALASEPGATEAERRTFGGGSFLACPIRVKDRMAGALVVSRVDGGDPLGEEERGLLGLIANDLAIALENARLFEENETTYIEILSALVVSMEARDPYLRRHSDRVTAGSLALAGHLGLSRRDRDLIAVGARLHDVGKVGLPDSILHKPGRLTDAEMEVMRSHPVLGDRIVRPLGKLGAVKPIIRNHHERWDGTGYPDGLKGEEIPLLTQIVSVADAWDAMTSDRAYRGAIPRERALEIIEGSAGTHFSAFLVEAFLEMESGGHLAPEALEAVVGEGI